MRQGWGLAWNTQRGGDGRMGAGPRLQAQHKQHVTCPSQAGMNGGFAEVRQDADGV